MQLTLSVLRGAGCARACAKIGAACLICLICLCCLGCAKPAQRAPARVDGGAAVEPHALAVVAGQSISVQEAARRINDYSPFLRRQLRRSPELLRKEVDKLIEEALIVAVAKERGYDRDPRVRMLIRQHMANLVREDVFAMVKLEQIEEAEIRAAYEQNLQRFSTALRLRAAHIQVRTQEAARALSEEAAGAGAKRFGKLARARSVDTATRHRGGELGWLTASKIRAQSQLFAAIAALKKPGEVSGPVRTPSGWHVVRLIERVEPKVRPYAEVREQVRLALFKEKRKRTYRQFIGELYDKFPIRRFDDRIGQIESQISQ